jgi:hypothetical protein
VQIPGDINGTTHRAYVFRSPIEVISPYSNPVVKTNLSRIYLFRELNLHRNDCGGTYGKDILVIATFGDVPCILRAMHHKFSSMLRRNCWSDFPEKEWRNISKSDCCNCSSGACMFGRPERRSEKLLSSGFLRNYARANVENDFNVMAEWFVTKPIQLRELANNTQR